MVRGPVVSKTQAEGASPAMQFVFGGLPRIPFAEKWDALLRSPEFARRVQGAGLGRCSPEAAHFVATEFLGDLWRERGMPLYESRVTSPDKEATKKVSAQIMEELCQGLGERDVASYSEVRRRGAGRASADAEAAVLRGVLLPVALGIAAEPVRRTSAPALTLDAVGPSKDQLRGEAAVQDLSLDPAPPFYAAWSRHVRKLITSGDEPVIVISARAGITKRFIESCIERARDGKRTPKRAGGSKELVAEVQRRICEHAGEELAAYLETLRDGDGDKRYQTHRLVLTQHLIPWLRDQKLTTFNPLFDSLYAPIDAPVGDWWEGFYRRLATQVEDAPTSSGENEDGFNRDLAIRASRHVRAFVLFHAEALKLVGSALTLDNKKALESALFSDPRSSCKQFLESRYADNFHYYKQGWADLHLRFLPLIEELGLTNYRARTGFFIPPETELVHPLLEWWAGEVVETVDGAESLPQRTGVLRGRTFARYLAWIWDSEDAKTLVEGSQGGSREAIYSEVVSLLVDDDAPSRVWQFSEAMRLESDSDRNGAAAYKLLRDEIYPRAAAAKLLQPADFGWQEFFGRYERLPVDLFTNWLSTCYDQREQGQILSAVAGHRARAVHGLLSLALEEFVPPQSTSRDSELRTALLERFDEISDRYLQTIRSTTNEMDRKINIGPALMAFRNWFETDGATSDALRPIPAIFRASTRENTQKLAPVESTESAPPSNGAEQQLGVAEEPKEIQNATRDPRLTNMSALVYTHFRDALQIAPDLLEQMTRQDLVIERPDHGVALYAEQHGEYLARRIPEDVMKVLRDYLELLDQSTEPQTSLWSHQP